MELWHQLSHVVDLVGVQYLMAKNQDEVEQEYDEFVQQLSDYMN